MYNRPEFIEKDPILFSHRYSAKQDIEITALLTSTIAWGNRKMILNSCEKMLGIMGRSPYDFVMSGSYSSFEESKNIHRTFFGRDFIYICNGLKKIYAENGDMENVFNRKNDTWNGISAFRETLAEANGGIYSRHISNPDGSACKRLHMMLRWLCRKDGIVDLGIWKSIYESWLYIPLDVHVSRIGRNLGLIERKANDRKTVELLTAELKKFCPEDPIKYDFALFGMGEADDSDM
jgi:uncharacterized protein (TIGR02757 family)